MQALPDGFPDEPDPAAAAPAQPRAGARQRARNEWDASDGVRRDAVENAALPCQEQPDAGAGRWAARERDDRERDESYRLMARSIVRSVLLDAAAELCTQAAAPSAARSCAAPEVAGRTVVLELGAVAQPQQAVLLGVAQPAQAEAQRTAKRLELAGLVAEPLQVVELPLAPVREVLQSERAEQVASPREPPRPASVRMAPAAPEVLSAA